MRGLLLLALLLAPISGRAADPSALWKIVNGQCVPHEESEHSPSPCAAVDIANGNAIVAVDVDAARAVQHGSPMVRSESQLRRESRVPAESLRGNIHEDRVQGAAALLVQHLPFTKTNLTRSQHFPVDLPIANALFAVEIGPRPHQFETHPGLDRCGKPGG